MQESEPLITPGFLLNAYANGFFPMAESRDDPRLFWLKPELRGIFPLDRFHISRSLARRMRRGGYQVSLDRDFAGVMEGCAAREETWINDRIRALYLELHQLGAAHSLEIWRDGRLIGGVYGVTLGAAFFGESMFSRATDASKLALAHLVEHLTHQGFRLFDTQFLTPHLASLGAIEIPQKQYMKLLNKALEYQADFAPNRRLPSGYEVVQRRTQVS